MTPTISSEELQRVSLFLQPEFFLYLDTTTEEWDEYLKLLKKTYHVAITRTEQDQLHREDPRSCSFAPVQRIQEFQD